MNLGFIHDHFMQELCKLDSTDRTERMGEAPAEEGV